MKEELKDKWILGFDERDSLSVLADGNRMVPFAYFLSDGSVDRDWSHWDGGWIAGYCFLVLCDQPSDPLALSPISPLDTLSECIQKVKDAGYVVYKQL